MLYRTLLKLKEKNGLTDDLKNHMLLFIRLMCFLQLGESQRNSTMN